MTKDFGSPGSIGGLIISEVAPWSSGNSPVASDWFEVRDRALIQHRTQIDPDGLWFAVPLQFQREVWPTEDFQLARSLVETTLPEDDLFAGIREDAR